VDPSGEGSMFDSQDVMRLQEDSEEDTLVKSQYITDSGARFSKAAT
jgi:hypothetical protein